MPDAQSRSTVALYGLIGMTVNPLSGTTITIDCRVTAPPALGSPLAEEDAPPTV